MAWSAMTNRKPASEARTVAKTAAQALPSAACAPQNRAKIQFISPDESAFAGACGSPGCRRDNVGDGSKPVNFGTSTTSPHYELDQKQTHAPQQNWLISRRQFHATSSFIAPTIRTANGSARPRTLTSRTGNSLISTPAVAATMSDTTS